MNKIYIIFTALDPRGTKYLYRHLQICFTPRLSIYGVGENGMKPYQVFDK